MVLATLPQCAGGGLMSREVIRSRAGEAVAVALISVCRTTQKLFLFELDYRMQITTLKSATNDLSASVCTFTSQEGDIS